MDYIGMTKEYNPHGGQTLDIKEIALIEVLVDIRDAFLDTRKVLCGIYDHLIMDK